MSSSGWKRALELEYGTAYDGRDPWVTAGFADEPFFRRGRKFLRILGYLASGPEGVHEFHFDCVRYIGLSRGVSVPIRRCPIICGRGSDANTQYDESVFHKVSVRKDMNSIW